MRLLICLLSLSLAACASAPTPPQCAVALMVLGAGQDGGRPQIAQPDDSAWRDPARRRMAASLALIDTRGQTRRWLFEATPDLRAQLQMLDQAYPAARPIGLDGIFLTHAHIGHYAGLMFLGHESAGAQGVTTYVMPRMARFLSEHGPWSQLVRRGNLALAPMADGQAQALGEDISVTPFLAPHRQEFSEVVGYRIEGPSRSAIFLPDIDSWEQWDEAGVRVEDVIASVEVAYLDATFYADGEIPGRDMSGFPHPFITHSMARFAALPASERAKVRFIHLNHTNPAQLPGPARDTGERAGMRDAAEGERAGL